MNRSTLRTLLMPAFLLEAAMITIFRTDFGNHKSALLFFFTSLAIGVAGIYLSFTTNDIALQSVQKNTAFKKVLLYTYSSIGFLLSGLFLNKILKVTPIDVKFSDIIPQVTTMVNRMLHGEFAYKAITDWGYEMYPTYLPLHWLPFTFAALLHIDYRWVSQIVFFAAIITFFVFAMRKNITAERFSWLLLLPLIFYFLIVKQEPNILGVTVEALIAGYYLFMALSIFSKSNIIRALGLLICVMSRYSIVLWVPLYILILFFTESKRNAILISAFCILGVLLVYVLPFMTTDPYIFTNGYKYHTNAALGEWSGQAWQQPGEKPIQLFRGVGFAGIIYDKVPGDLLAKLNFARVTHLSVSLFITVLLGFFFYWYRAKIKSYRIFLLASLKIYLVFFYNFIQIPYTYLFLTVILLSLPILAIAMISQPKPVLNIENN